MSAMRAIGGKCRALMAAAAVPKARKVANAAKKTGGGGGGGGGVGVPQGILKPVPISPTLAEFIGASEASRTDAVKKVWDHIKSNNLQNPENKREILCDEKLKRLFNGKDTVGFLEIAKLLSQHFKTG